MGALNLRRLPVLLLPLLLIVGVMQSSPALAVSYGPGWQLVSGPEGSHLDGASGSIYTFRAGDSAYEVLPATAVLHACWGYWAYFPSGGTLSSGPDSAPCSVPSSSGGWVMVGNPSGTSPAYVAGADSALTYGASGYVNGTTLPPGSRAWVMSNGAVTVTATGGGAPSATFVNCDVALARLQLDSEEQALIQAINAYRASRNLGALQPSEALERPSAWKADNMASSRNLNHDDATRSWQQRLADCGANGSQLNENLAWGRDTASGTLQDWQGSPMHNANLLDPNLHFIGVKRARATDPTDIYRWYWVAVFSGSL